MEVSLWVASTPRHEWVSQLKEAGITVVSNGFPDPKGIDLLHDHGLWLASNHSVALFASRHGIPRMVSPRGMLEPWALNHRKWKKRLAWWLYQRGDLLTASALHATAPSEEAQFRKLGLKMPVFVVPNGVEGKIEKLKAKDKNQITTHPNQKTALFLGRIHPKKGLPLLVKAWARVRPQGWKMRVIGPDELGHRAEIAGMIHAAGLDDDWSLEGEVSDAAKWEIYGAADLFILPTHSENFGISVAEALAAGLPVITTTGAPWSGLEEHRCGWWVEPQADALAVALAAATSSGGDCLREMGLRGRVWMESDFSWKGVAESMSRAYKTMISTDS
jgi:glycosyltransferase involved in cell wall biosynthesis